MRLRFALALLVSIILIGTASWYRFGTTKFAQQPNIIAVEQPDINKEGTLQEYFASTGLNSKVATSSAATQPLSNTDLFGRSLFVDYVGLASQGEITGSDLDSLAQQYVSRIPGLHQPLVITKADLQIVPNSKTNFENYSKAFVSIYDSYAKKVSGAYPGNTVGGLDPAFYTFTSVLSAAYTEVATKLEKIPVPTSLVATHLELVNHYLSGALAMSEISKSKEDPAAAFAGLIFLNDNLDKETLLISRINQILTSNGI